MANQSLSLECAHTHRRKVKRKHIQKKATAKKKFGRGKKDADKDTVVDSVSV